MQAQRQARQPEMTVLVVEDEWLLRADIAEELREAGCEVLETGLGEEAVQILHDRGDISLLVTDIQLAGRIDGWQVAHEARRADPDIAVIYASGDAGDDPRRVEASAFFSKPCSAAELASFGKSQACQRAHPGEPAAASGPAARRN